MSNRRRLIIALALVVLISMGGAAWWLWPKAHAEGALKLYGDIDIRQVDLAFNNSERIAEVLVQEGDVVRRGQVVARLDTSRLLPETAQAQAAADAQGDVVARLRHGSRGEEIGQARANLASARADGANAQRQLDRLQALAQQSAGRGVSRQDLDNARAALDVANAKAAALQQTLALVVAGPRREDVDQAQAQLTGAKAQLGLLQAQLRDAELVAPADAIVRSRLMEPGEMASPQKPVLSLAITSPKWVRAYAPETELARLREGMAAEVTVDGLPGRVFHGWLGYISPVSEFTPRSVETEALRTSLVYEVRVYVQDPAGELHLGAPATVVLTPGAARR